MTTRDPRRHWDRQAAIYALDEGHRRFRRFLDLYEESCWRYIEPVLPDVDASVILEAGCGTGRWVVRLAPMGYRMVLSDLSPEMIKHARDKVEQLGLSPHVTAYHVLDICDMHTLSEASFDLVLALGGPLTLCQDANMAVNQFRRVMKPGGYVICDAANRYRTALDLVRDNNMSQLARVLDTGHFSRADGLIDHRFGPQELADLFKAHGMEALHVAGICPFFDFLPKKEHIRILDDAHVYAAMLDVSRRYAEDPFVVALSGRLLVVAQRQE
jgi:ubiquinone/menaquinone biosynthesis C-methylase UbiE